MNPLEKINHLFSSKVYLHSESGVSEEDDNGLMNTWVVSRKYCAYYCVDFSNLVEAKQSSGLENHLQLCSPFTNPDYWVAWKNGCAQAWVWDKDAVNDVIGSHVSESHNRHKLNIVPESIFFPNPESGLQTFRTADGFVIQNWRDGILNEERFWSTEIDESEKKKFLLGAGLSPDSEIELVAKTTSVWQGYYPTRKLFRALEPLMVLSAALAMCFVAAYQLMSWLFVSFLVMTTENELKEMKNSLQVTADLRMEAYETRDRSLIFNQLGKVSQLELMSHIAEKLPSLESGSGQIMKWVQQEDELSFIIDKPVAGLEAYAIALEEVEGITGVMLVPNDRANILTVKATVKE